MRFTSVYYILLALSGVSAFLLPQRVSEAARPMMGTLLTPVAQSSRAIAAWATGQSAGSSSAAAADDRPADEIVRENQELRLANEKLAYDLAQYQALVAERAKIDPEIRDLCTSVAVIGNDGGGVRDALALKATGLSGLEDGMFVLHNRDVVGRLITGKAGAQVRLVTDLQSRVQAYFVPFRRNGGNAKPATRQTADRGNRPAGAYDLPTRVIEGAGQGRMVCRNIPFADVDRVKLSKGDWVMLDDPDWPAKLQGRRLGVVTKINLSSKMMAEIEIKPDPEVLKLREVLVLTKEK